MRYNLLRLAAPLLPPPAGAPFCPRTLDPPSPAGSGVGAGRTPANPRLAPSAVSILPPRNGASVLAFTYIYLMLARSHYECASAPVRYAGRYGCGGDGVGRGRSVLLAETVYCPREQRIRERL